MTKKNSYEDRLARVTAYIHEHYEEDIDLMKLAEIACLSPYHWHRIYRAFYGETLAATVRRLRLHHAAGHLVKETMNIDDIARRAGYSSLQAFTRAFNAAYGMPPAQFRSDGRHAPSMSAQRTETYDMTSYTVEIKDMPAFRLATIPHTGPYMEIGKAFDTLFGIFASRNLLGPEVRSIGIYYDDPCSVAPESLRSCAGMVVDESFVITPPLEEARIVPGPHAAMIYKGPYSGLEAAYQWLYGEWLVKSGREPADAPAYEEYLNNPREVAPAELLTAIHLPLR
jgi:AraC family transcriptional regulator